MGVQSPALQIADVVAAVGTDQRAVSLHIVPQGLHNEDGVDFKHHRRDNCVVGCRPVHVQQHAATAGSLCACNHQLLTHLWTVAHCDEHRQ